jgi:hypothetical protein
VNFRKQPGCLIVVFAALVVGCSAKDSQTAKSNGSKQFNSVASIKRRLAEIAGQANGAAPAEIDPNTRLDGAKAGPGLKLTTTYTLVNAESDGINSSTFEPKLGPLIKTGSCQNPDLRPLIDQGVLVVLEYRGNDGKPIGTLNINRDTCGALK